MEKSYGWVTKLVNVADLKSVEPCARAGSIPAPAIKIMRL